MRTLISSLVEKNPGKHRSMKPGSKSFIFLFLYYNYFITNFQLKEAAHSKNMDETENCMPKANKTILKKIKFWGLDVFELFRTPKMRKVSLSVFFCWFAAGLGYWGISLAGVYFR